MRNDTDRSRKNRVIGVRAFLTLADYRPSERFRVGDLQDLLPSEPFGNVIFADHAKLEASATRLEQAARKFTAEIATGAGIAEELQPAEAELDVDLKVRGGKQSQIARGSSTAVELQRENRTAAMRARTSFPV